MVISVKFNFVSRSSLDVTVKYYQIGRSAEKKTLHVLTNHRLKREVSYRFAVEFFKEKNFEKKDMS